MQFATLADVSKDFEHFAREALSAPLTITHQGREHLVRLSHAECTRLKELDRVHEPNASA